MKFILAFLLSINLFASNIKSENIKIVLNDIEKEYISCLKEKRLTHMECVRVKEMQIADLEILDQNEMYFQANIKARKAKENAPKKEKTKEEIELEKCLDKADTKEETIKCFRKE